MSDREFSIDWPHGYVTRDGRKARIVCSDVANTYPIAAIVKNNDDSESIFLYCENGRYLIGEIDKLDLFNAPAPKVRHERWAQFYESYEAQTVYCAMRDSKADAIKVAENFGVLIGEPQCVFVEVKSK